MTRVISDRISEITLWKKLLILQAVKTLSPIDKLNLHSNLQLLPGSIRRAAEVFNRAHDRICVQDILRAIQIVFEDLEEHSRMR